MTYSNKDLRVGRYDVLMRRECKSQIASVAHGKVSV